MKTNITRTIIICSVVGIIMSACDVQEREETIPIEKFPEKYICKDSKLEFQTDVIVSKEINKELYECTAATISFSPKEILPYVFPQGNDSKFFQSDGNNYIDYQGRSLFIDSDYVAYNSNSEREKTLMSNFSLFPENYTADQFNVLTEAELSCEECNKDSILKTLSAWGITNCNLFKGYVLDYKKSQKENDRDGDVEDSIYWLGNEKCQGVPVFCSEFSKNLNDTWAPIQVLSTSGEIEKVQILYYFKFQYNERKIKLKPFEKIVESIQEEYDNLLTDNKYIATKAELFFWVDVNQDTQNYEMRPVWVFSICEYNSNTKIENSEYQEFVDASSGENIEVGD